MMMAFLFAAAASASSAIPARREFPVDDKSPPCVDFYQHACNRVNASFQLRPDRSKHVFAFNDSSERLLEAKQKWLEDLTKAAKPPSSPRARELRDVYQACMNEPAGAAEEKALVRIVTSEMRAVASNVALSELIARKVLTEDYSFFQFGSVPNQDDPAVYDLYLVATPMTLPERSFYAKTEVMRGFEGVVASFFRTIDAKDEIGSGKGPKRTPEARAKDLLRFETQFAQTFPLPVEMRERFNAKRDVSAKDLAVRYARLGLTPFARSLPASIKVRDLSPENFKWFDEALATTPLATLKDLYLWHALSEEMDDAYPEFFKKRFAFSRDFLGGPEKRSVRGERCTRLIMGSFDKEIDAELVDQLFPNFPTERFVALAERVRGSIVSGLEANDWLTPEARAEAVRKMKTAKLQLVKPMTEKEWDFNPPADYAPDKRLGNERLLSRKLIEKTLKQLSEPRDRSEWSMGPLTVNAYYSPSDNKFVMPIGILQYPFFDQAAPDEVNLGAVGAVIGHELGHGIDDKGARYDAEGRLKSWMSDADLAAFKTRGARLVAEFNKAGHDGELTLGENIGDLVGLTFAYRAAFPDGKGEPAAKRAFFLQFARAWCGVLRPKYREMLLKTDPHAMGDARVNEQMKHQPGFAEAFSCKAGDPMTLGADERVRIW